MLEIIQGKTAVAEASRVYDLSPAEIESWVNEGTRGMENVLRATPENVRGQYQRPLQELQQACGEAMLELRARKQRQSLLNEGVSARLSQLCQWFDVPRRTMYYQPVKSRPKVDAQFAEPIKAMIEENPSFGYRTVAHLRGFNKNTVQRIFQIKGWQVRKRPIGMRPRIQALPSVAKAPNERWSTDLCRIWAGRDGWASLALVIDCHTRELLGWHLPSDHGRQRAAAGPHRPVRNAGGRARAVRAAIRTLKEQCVHRHRFESLQHASRVIGDWIGFYNHQRPHQALKMGTPAEAYALAA